MSWDNDDTYILTNSKDSVKTVKVFVGGEAMQYSESEFVSPDIAWNAIQEFIETGKHSESQNWKLS